MGSQSRRERLAVPARQLALQPDVPFLPCHCRPLLLRLEQARRPALEDYVARPPRLGLWVLINGIWYEFQRDENCTEIALDSVRLFAMALE